MSVGENIKLRRIKENISQKDLAEWAGITASMLSQIERGKKPLSLETGWYIANALQCSIYDLVKVNCKIELTETNE